MDDRAVVELLCIHYTDSGERAAISELATRFGIERSLVENHPGFVAKRSVCDDLRVEPAAVRILVIQASSHGASLPRRARSPMPSR